MNRAPVKVQVRWVTDGESGAASVVSLVGGVSGPCVCIAANCWQSVAILASSWAFNACEACKASVCSWRFARCKRQISMEPSVVRRLLSTSKRCTRSSFRPVMGSWQNSRSSFSWATVSERMLARTQELRSAMLVAKRWQATAIVCVGVKWQDRAMFGVFVKQWWGEPVSKTRK